MIAAPYRIMSPAIELARLKVSAEVLPSFPIRSDELSVDTVTLAFDIDVPKLVAPGAGSITFPPVPCRASAGKVGLWTARVMGPPADIVAEVWKVAVPELVPVDTVIEPLVVVRLA